MAQDDEGIKIPSELDWLVDVPLFIDEERVNRLYDVTTQPLSEEYVYNPTSIQSGKESEDERTSEGRMALRLGTSSALDLLGLKAEGEGELKTGDRQLDKETLSESYSATTTPQRQLVQIAIKYENSDQHQIFKNTSPDEIDWRKKENIRSSPRELVFLELPARNEVSATNNAENKPAPEEIPTRTKFVPTAAEFEDGTVEPLYQNLDTDSEKPPTYPEIGERFDIDGDGNEEKITTGNVQEARQKYWRWFEQNFNASNTTRLVEKAAEEHGDIRWIDYRLPLNKAGETLHLHIQPREEYSTGTFAYNLIKRGYKHGMRIVGTVKSEPDMDVLAIYEK